MTTAFDQLMLDLFTTALEGGINYWAEVSAYHWHKGDSSEHDDESGIDYAGFYAKIHPYEPNDDDETTLVVNRKVMVNGWHQATSVWRNKIHWSSGERPPFFVGDNLDDDWDFDACDADVIVQLGLFGEIIYG